MIYVILGAPGSGKTTYVQERMSVGDIVIDFDLLYSALTGLPDHQYEPSVSERVEDLRGYLIESIGSYPEIRHTWITVCDPRTIAEYLPTDLTIEKREIQTSEKECLRRCVARGGDYEHWKTMLSRYFKKPKEKPEWEN